MVISIWEHFKYACLLYLKKVERKRYKNVFFKQPNALYFELRVCSNDVFK